MAEITRPGSSPFGRARSQSVIDESGGSFGCGASPLLWVKITTTLVYDEVKQGTENFGRPEARRPFSANAEKGVAATRSSPRSSLGLPGRSWEGDVLGYTGDVKGVNGVT